MKSIQRQTYPAEFLETIVVDNQSSDCTKELALGFTEKVFDVGPERSAQRYLQRTARREGRSAIPEENSEALNSNLQP